MKKFMQKELSKGARFVNGTTATIGKGAAEKSAA
jgi:hypothetical protein